MLQQVHPELGEGLVLSLSKGSAGASFDIAQDGAGMRRDLAA
jgi:hypothetical protein